MNKQYYLLIFNACSIAQILGPISSLEEIYCLIAKDISSDKNEQIQIMNLIHHNEFDFLNGKYSYLILSLDDNFKLSDAL